MSSGCGEAGWNFGRPGRSRSGRTGSCSWPTTPRPTVFAVDVADPGPGGRVGAVRPGGRRRAGRLVPGLRARRRRASGTWRSTRCRTTCTCRCSAAAATAAQAVLVRIGRLDGSVTDVPLDGRARRRGGDRRRPGRQTTSGSTSPFRSATRARSSQVGERTIRILRQPIRTSTVTDMAYVDGTLLDRRACRTRSSPPGCAASRSRSATASRGSSLEIFHVSHGKWETAAPIRAFVPYDGGASILASYTCTPVVHFPLADLHARRQGRRPDGRRARRGEPAAGHGVVPPGRRGVPARGQLRARPGQDRLPGHRRPGAADRADASRSACPGRPRTCRASPGWPTWATATCWPCRATTRPPAPALAEDRDSLVGRSARRDRQAGVPWSRSGGADCIRLRGGCPPGRSARSRAGTAGRRRRPGLPPMAGRLVRDGDDLCFVPRFAFVDGTAYAVTVDGAGAASWLAAAPGRIRRDRGAGHLPDRGRGAAQPAPALRLVLGADERGLGRRARRGSPTMTAARSPGALLPSRARAVGRRPPPPDRPARPGPHQARPGRPPRGRLPAAVRRAVPARRRQRVPRRARDPAAGARRSGGTRSATTSAARSTRATGSLDVPPGPEPPNRWRSASTGRSITACSPAACT